MQLKYTFLFLALALTGCRSAQNVTTSKASSEQSIVILYDNDVHCAIDGYSLMAGLRNDIADTAQVALVSSGDFLQGGTAGAISHGQYIADIMKHMHYAAITLGNHEFDYYVPAMKDLLGQIGAPVTCVNFRDMKDQRVYLPYVIRQMGNKKVSFIGVVTPTTFYTESYAFLDKDDQPIYNLAEKEVYRLVQDQVDAVRSQGVDYVIILSHLGESHNPLNVDSHGLIAQSHGIDVVLDGHTHSVIPQETVLDSEGKPVLITQTGTKFMNVGKLVLRADGRKSTELISRNKLLHKDPEVQHAIDSIQQLSDEIVKRPICQSDVDLVILDAKGNQAVRVGETNAGDIVTDAYRWLSKADIAITNGGGIRTEAKAGKLTYGDIVALLPYDNYVSVVAVKGQELIDLLQACTQYLPTANGDFPQVSGMKFTVNVGKPNPISDLVIEDQTTGEYLPVDPERVYRLATIDYGITGGGLQGKLKKNEILVPNICLYSESLIQYVTEKLGGHIDKEYAKPQGRIKIKY